MLAGGEFVAARPNFGEAEVVGGDDLFGCFPPAGVLCPELTRCSLFTSVNHCYILFIEREGGRLG